MTVLARRPLVLDGVRFDAVTLGDGDPSVVFVNGLGTSLEEWTFVAPEIAKRCRVVCFNRRQAGSSGPIRAHLAAEMVDDMVRLLAGLQVPAPYLLVGHSWGGLVARCFAAQHPDDVAGMVYVDAANERVDGQIPSRLGTALYGVMVLAVRRRWVRRRMMRAVGFDRLPAEERSLTDREMGSRDFGRTARAEHAGVAGSCRELAETAPDLPDVPTRILLAGGRPGLMTKAAAKTYARIRAVWEDSAAGLSNASIQVVEGSGHYISLDAPQAVVAAIEDVLEIVKQV